MRCNIAGHLTGSELTMVDPLHYNDRGAVFGLGVRYFILSQLTKAKDKKQIEWGMARLPTLNQFLIFTMHGESNMVIIFFSTDRFIN